MNKIKVLMINNVNPSVIEDAAIDTIKINDKMRIKDVIKLCEDNKQFKDFKYFDKYLHPSFEKLLRAKYGKEKGKMNWKIDMESLYVYKVSEYLGDAVIVINSHGGIGDPGSDILIGYLVGKVIDFIIKLVSKVYVTYNAAVKIIEKETGKYIEYINDVINIECSWPKGFISNDDFKRKNKVEKRIMKKLGYKIKDGNWYKKEY